MLKRILYAAVLAAILIPISASAQTKLLRFPDVHGDKVVFTYGGDLWTAPMFREAGLGPLIGKRSWGGVIGIGNRGTLIDGGTIFVPESAFASSKGQWIIEGYGVDPDIEVENDPKSLIDGKDPQLERAVAEIMKKLSKPVKLPPRPAAPLKTPDAKMRP